MNFQNCSVCGRERNYTDLYECVISKEPVCADKKECCISNFLGIPNFDVKRKYANIFHVIYSATDEDGRKVLNWIINNSTILNNIIDTKDKILAAMNNKDADALSKILEAVVFLKKEPQ